MKTIVLTVAIIALPVMALAQSGPGPLPSPWAYGPSLSILYNNGEIDIGNPSGAATLGAGWINLSGGLAVNGVAIPGAIGSQPANRVYASPCGAPGTPTIRAICNGDLPTNIAVGGTFSVTGATTLGATAISGALSGTGISNYFASPPCIGCTAPNAAHVTTLAATTSATVPTMAITDNSANVATTAFVLSQLPLINIVDYGADPTGAADSCGTPLTNAIAAIPAAGGTLYWPRGSYLCGTQIAPINKSIGVVGDGAGISIITFTSATAGAAGINISQNSLSYTTTISGLTVRTSVAQPSNSGINVSYSIAPNVDRTVTIRNVSVDGGAANSNYWHVGIACNACGYGRLNDFHIKGKNEGNPPTGISTSNMLSGISLSARSTDMRIEDGAIVFSFYGVYISGDSESQQFSDTTMLGTNYGWFNDDFLGSGDTTSIQQAPGPRIYNSHCAAYIACVYIKGWGQSVISGNLFYKRPESVLAFNAITLTQGSYQGPVIAGTNFTSIVNNTFVGFFAGGSTATGIYFDPVYTSGNNIQSNTIVALTNFANFNSGATTNMVLNNTAISGTITGSWFVNPSTGTIAINNVPVNSGTDTGTIVLPANSTTPNVGGYVASNFLTANTSATTITNFTNGYVGQIITIVANDANTTLQNNAGLILHGGTNYVMSTGNTLTLKREQSTYWREISRS